MRHSSSKGPHSRVPYSVTAADRFVELTGDGGMHVEPSPIARMRKGTPVRHRVCLVGNRRLFNVAMIQLLSGSEFDLCQQVTGPEDLVGPHTADIPRIDLLVVDDPHSDLSILTQVHQALPDTPMVVLCEKPSASLIHLCLKLKAAGPLSESLDQESFLQILKVAAEGHPMIPHACAAMLLDQPVVSTDADVLTVLAQLSQRERDILRNVSTGLANKQIARKLKISETTVKSHVKSLLMKLNVHNRTQAAIWAHQCGFVHAEPEEGRRVNGAAGPIERQQHRQQLGHVPA